MDVRPLGAGLPACRTQALFKSRDLEVIRLVLQAGQSLPMHRVAGDITVQCLEGHLQITTGAGPLPLPAGHLLFLPAGIDHDVRAIDDASALVTIALR